MADSMDPVMLFVGKLHEYEPLPTIVLALVRHRPGSSSLPEPFGVFLTSSQFVHQCFQRYEPRSLGIYAFLLLVVPAVGSGVLAAGASSVLGPLFRTYAIFYTTLISSVVFYRLSPFHPLARYPGPVLAKVSKLWFVSIRGGCPSGWG